MRINEIIFEGGWENTSTQSTVITPGVVKVALGVMGNNFIPDFNKFLNSQGIEPVKMGHPTGSSAHYQKDTEDTIYGDIDLQIIVPYVEGKNTSGERQSFWSSTVAKFIKSHLSSCSHNSSIIGTLNGSNRSSFSISIGTHTRPVFG